MSSEESVEDFIMVVAVKLLSAVNKLGANPYVAVGVDTHSGKIIRGQLLCLTS